TVCRNYCSTYQRLHNSVKAALINKGSNLGGNLTGFLSMRSDAALAQKFRAVWPLLDERTRRIMAANEAIGLGYGGVSVVHRACGLSRKAIDKGVREIQEGDCPGEGHIRRAGAGRKNITVSDPRLLRALDHLIEGETRGDPESPLRWICKSTRAIALQ